MAQGKAFFISPQGAVLRVTTSHIAMVIEDPAMFKMKRSKIEEVFARHDEPLGHEGYAREVILTDLLRRRWIRIREHQAYWSIQFSTLSPRTKSHIRKWARTALQRGIVRDRYAEARLEGLADGFHLRIEVARVVTSSVFEVEGAERWRLQWPTDRRYAESVTQQTVP